MLTGLPGEAFERLSRYARSWIGGLAKVLFRCRTIFKFFLPLAIIYYDSHHLESCLERVSTNILQPLLSDHLTSGLRQKPLSRVF